MKETPPGLAPGECQAISVGKSLMPVNPSTDWLVGRGRRRAQSSYHRGPGSPVVWMELPHAEPQDSARPSDRIRRIAPVRLVADLDVAATADADATADQL